MVAAVSLQLLKHETLPYQDLLSLVRLNRRLLTYGLALALASSVLFGIVPATELLRVQHFGAMARTRRKWFQNFYIVGQVGAATLLVVLTGLLLKSLKTVQSLRPGFDSRDLTTAFVIKPTTMKTSTSLSAFGLLISARGSIGGIGFFPFRSAAIVRPVCLISKVAIICRESRSGTQRRTRFHQAILKHFGFRCCGDVSYRNSTRLGLHQSVSSMRVWQSGSSRMKTLLATKSVCIMARPESLASLQRCAIPLSRALRCRWCTTL